MTGGRIATRRQLVTLVSGVAVATAVFAAVPAALVVVVGSPLPHHLGRATLWSTGGLVDGLSVVAWVAWAKCCWPVLQAVTRRARRRDDTPLAGAPLADRLAVRIVGALFVLGSVASLSGTAGAAGAPPSPAAVTLSQVATGSGRAPAPAAPAPPPAAAPPEAGAPPPAGAPPAAAEEPGTTGEAVPREYTVEPGDTLWSIAQRLYGRGADWWAIAACNLGRTMAGGQRFLDPALIYPGWVLVLPGGGWPTGGASPAPARPETARHEGPSVPQVLEAATSRRAAARTHSHTHGRRPRAGGDRRPAGGTPPMPLPELASLGFGSLLAAALARRIRTTRRSTGGSRPDRTVDGAPPPAPDRATETADLLAPFDGAPVLNWAEAANRLLRASLAEAVNGRPPPNVRLLRVGPDGVDVWLAGDVDRAPPPWRALEPHRWRLPATVDPSALRRMAEPHRPQFPVAVPAGQDDGGSWVIPLPPGSRLPVLGPESEHLVRAMKTAAGSWEWSEHVLVTGDPAVAEEATSTELRRDGHPFDVLFVGDPGLLTGRAAARCSVITTLPVPASDLTVTVDHQATSLHPLGVTLTPDLLGPVQAAALGEALAGEGPSPGGGGPPDGRASGREPPDGRRSGVRSGAAAAENGTGVELEVDIAVRPGHRAPAAAPVETPLADVPAPGPVTVRLLTAVPRIDGLASPLPPKRARRAIELVAYLALHHPDPVTGDRLRTRVLGSADADAAAKTLFNTAGAARRALGLDDQGKPYLPSATKAGLYRLSALVTADAARAAVLVTAGLAAGDPLAAMALLRAALDLVEGEPLGGVRTGYGWWGAEGHEGRTAALLVDAACELARLAVAAGRPALGRWGLAQARMVDPYSEALTRAAMRVAAESGDGDRLHREWVECRRRVDELDPGSLPSAQTQRLYADLRRSVPALAVGDEG